MSMAPMTNIGMLRSPVSGSLDLYNKTIPMAAISPKMDMAPTEPNVDWSPNMKLRLGMNVTVEQQKKNQHNTKPSFSSSFSSSFFSSDMETYLTLFTLI